MRHNWRILLPSIHAGIALALLVNLYIPSWQAWKAARKRDVVAQQYVEAEARAGHWPPPDGVMFEPDYFGPPWQIGVLFPADLPAILSAGVLIIPSNTRDRLLDPGPGRILPSTRILIFAALFVLTVALQWYLIAYLTEPPKTSATWEWFLRMVPIALVPVGLMPSQGWLDIVRFASIPLWVFIVVGILWQYWKSGRRTLLHRQRCKNSAHDQNHDPLG